MLLLLYLFFFPQCLFSNSSAHLYVLVEGSFSTVFPYLVQQDISAREFSDMQENYRQSWSLEQLQRRWRSGAHIWKKLSSLSPTPSRRDLPQSWCQPPAPFHSYWLHFSLSWGFSYHMCISHYIVLPSGGTGLLALYWMCPECCCSEHFVNKEGDRTI